MKLKVKRTIEKFNMIQKNDNIICGVSGGADSMALLNILLSISSDGYNLKIYVCHVNHMLRGKESQRDEDFVRNFSVKNNIPFFLNKENIADNAKKKSLSIEEYGRHVRYDFFSKIANKYNGKIATAHNISDMTETIIYNMVRGTGIRGIRGIAPIDGKIIRPIIQCHKEEIEEYLMENGVPNVFDSTNSQDIYTRNKIRNNVLPVFNNINNKYAENFFSLSRQADEVDDFLLQEAEKLFTRNRLDVIEERIFEKYSTTEIKNAHTVIVKRGIIEILKKHNLSVNEKNINNIVDIIKNNGKINIAKNIFIKSKENILSFYYENIKADTPFNTLVMLGENGLRGDKKAILEVFDFSNIKNNIKENDLDNFINYDIIEKTNLYLRSRLPKDKVKLKNRGVTKTLKKLMTESKIPLDKRNDTAVLVSNDEIVWVEGFGVAENFSVKDDSVEKVLVVSILN